MCESAGIKLEYLPPYFPDFNPIKDAFAELKVWIHRNYILAEGCISFKGFLDLALRSMAGRPGTTSGLRTSRCEQKSHSWGDNSY